MMGRATREARKHGRRGGIAVAMVVALVVLQLVVVGMVVAGSRDRALGVHRVESLRTLYAAESGVAMSLRELAIGEDVDGDGVIGGVSADGYAETGPRLLSTRINTQVEVITPTTGHVVAQGLASDASRTLRVAYAIPSSGGEGGGGGSGLAAEYFSLGSAPGSLAGVNWSAAPAANGPVAFVNFGSAVNANNPLWNTGPTSHVAMRLRGLIAIPEAGLWTFRLGADEAARLLIDGVVVVDHDGPHNFSTKNGSATLTAGTHEIELLYCDSTGQNGLTLAWQGPSVPSMVTVPPSVLTFDVAPSPEFPPIAVADIVQVWGDETGEAAYIDGFDAAVGTYGGANVLTDRLLLATNATGSQKMQMSGLAQVRGSVQVGPGGSPATVIAQWGGSQITAGASARLTALGIHRVLQPHVTMPASSGSQTYTSSFTINSNRTFQDLGIWGASTVVTITGDVVIQCSGSFSIGDQVKIELAPGARLTFFVGGDFNVYADGAVNMNTGDPSRCWVFMTGDGRKALFTDRSKFVGHVRNPKGGMELWGAYSPGSEFFGTFHGRTFMMGDRTRFHADVSLMRSGSGGDSGGDGGGSGSGVVVSGWSLDQ